MKIITADERLAEKSGAKILIVGVPKIGKTSLLRTLDPNRTLFIDLEAGDLAVADVAAATLRPQTWDDCRNLACFLTVPIRPYRPPRAIPRRISKPCAPTSRPCSSGASTPISLIPSLSLAD